MVEKMDMSCCKKKQKKTLFIEEKKEKIRDVEQKGNRAIGKKLMDKKVKRKRENTKGIKEMTKIIEKKS